MNLCLKFVDKNALGDWNTPYEKYGHEIKWYLFEQLMCLHKNTELHLATKIRSRHINYHKN